MKMTTAKESRLSYTAHGIKGKNGEAIGGIGNKVNYLPAWYDFDPVRLEIRLTVKSYEPLEIIPHGCNVRNDSDYMADYYDKDKLTIPATAGAEFLAAAIGYKKAVESWRKKGEKMDYYRRDAEQADRNADALRLAEQIASGELYALAKAAKIGKDKKFKPLVYIAGAYYDIELLYEYASTLTGTFKYRKGYAFDPRWAGIVIEGENGKAFVLPVRPSANDKKSVIKEYKQKPYIFPELVGANSEHVFYRDKKTYALYTDWEGEIWYCGDAYGDIDFNSRLILPKYPVDGVRLVTD